MQQRVASVADSLIELWEIPEEEENHITYDDEDSAKASKGQSSKPQMDPKKLKRIMSNRISAQKSRMKKVQYVMNMESQAKFFQNQIAMLRPQVAASRNQKQLLILEQRTLNQQLAVQEKECMLKEAKIEMNKAELQSLRQLYVIQQKQLREQALAFDWDASNSSSFNHCGLRQSIQGQNGENTSLQVDITPNGNQQMLIPGWENIFRVDEQKPNLSSGQLQGMLSNNATISNFHYRFV